MLTFQSTMYILKFEREFNTTQTTTTLLTKIVKMKDYLINNQDFI